MLMKQEPVNSTLVLPPGAFRLLLAYVVFETHTLPVHLGGAAVYLFFTLSGYWIYLMWHSTYKYADRPYRIFIISRLWRLLPIYYTALAVRVALEIFLPRYSGSSFPAFGSLLGLHFYLSNLIILGYDRLPADDVAMLLPAVWSLDIELRFYLLAPFVVFLFDRSTKVVEQLIWLIAILGLLVYLMYFRSETGQSGYLINYLIFFLFGLKAAKSNWTPDLMVLKCFSVLGGAVIVFCLLVPAARSLIMTGRFTGPFTSYNMQLNVLVALLFVPYALATVHRKLVRPKAASADRHLANITYIVYLFHYLAIYLMHFLPPSMAAQRVPRVIAAWVMVFAVSWIVYRLIDRPIDKRRHNFVKAHFISTEREAGSRAKLAPDID